VAAATAADIDGMVSRADAGLSAAEVERLRALLTLNRNVFAPVLHAPGQAQHEAHQIEVEGHWPIKVAPQRVSPKELVVQKTEIGKMLGAGVVRPSHSLWASPVVLVTKKDRSTQFCINYCGLNQVTKQDSYPLPHVDNILNMLAGSVWRSSLNLILGYWQIPVHKDNIEKTVFATRHGTFEFTVMPFGLTNTPASFQRDMDIILSGLNWVSTLVYINNIIVFSISFKDHLQHLQEVFDRLHTTNMFMKPSKCNFCQTKLPFLRHLMQKDGITTDPKKVCVVHKMAQPINTTEVQAFLGLCNYYQQFVPAFAEVTEPLYQLLQAKPFHGVVWTLECKAAFIQLKEALTTAPVLTFPDFKRPFYLHTDVSKLAIRAVLSQWT
jgi:hypothetical protein